MENQPSFSQPSIPCGKPGIRQPAHRTRIRRAARFRIPALIGLSLFTGAACEAAETALDRYVAAPDATYACRLIRTLDEDMCRTHVLELTSQTWLTTHEVSQPVWKHWLTITIPAQANPKAALLFIGAGSNDREAPVDADPQLKKAALAARSVVADLKMVPNQPLVFEGDGRKRYEDSLIAWCWDRFLRTGDERWPTRLPMTKAAVRAMDAVQQFCATNSPGALNLEGFVVAGASKRGWTTWTTAAVDKRVKAIIPLVIDLLNIEPSFIHHWEAYGSYAPAVGDYEAQGIMNWQGTEAYRRLMHIEEPFEYRERFTMPKFIINATGDQFFLPDSSQFYFEELPGPKYLRYVPNADHSLRNTDALETLIACHQAILNDTPLPRFTWTTDSEGVIRVHTRDRPDQVRFWQATSPNARDFRFDTIGAAWKDSPLTDQGDGKFAAQVVPPRRGWTAGFIELTYGQDSGNAPFKFTTDVLVMPKVMPFRFPEKR